MLFRLNPFIETSYRLNALEKTDKNISKRIQYSIEPLVIYDTDDYIEKTEKIESLIHHTVTYIPYTKENITKLKELGCGYSLHGCKSCGNKYTQIRLQVFEVVTDE